MYAAELHLLGSSVLPRRTAGQIWVVAPRGGLIWDTSAGDRGESPAAYTPGGVGITELGLAGLLAVSTGPAASTKVTAAVLLYRAVTYLPSIPLGALAFLTWRFTPTLLTTNLHHDRQESQHRHVASGQPQSMSPLDEVAGRR